MSFQSIKHQRFDLKHGACNLIDDLVAVDEAICIFINDEFNRTLIATPNMVKELTVGYLIGEGIIESVEDLKSLEVEPLKILVELKKDVNLNALNMSKIELITTACGAPSIPLKIDQSEPLTNLSSIRFEAEKIWGMVKELNKRSALFRKTGGTHSAMLCSTSGEIIAFAEDVGRHNAVDKVIGAGILKEKDLKDCLLVSSGRQSGEMVLKAARGGIPVIASMAGPLRTGIKIAEKLGLTLICFVRGRRMNVYTHPERVVFTV